MQEVWKSIEGYEGKYEVSNLGRVKSLKDNHGYHRELIRVPRISNSGYLYVSLWNGCRARAKKIHRLVAETFLERPADAQCVNHINGVKTDNRLENLEWCTYSYNAKHAVETGLNKDPIKHLPDMHGVHGKDHPTSKPIAQYTKDGEFIAEYESGVEAAKALGLRASSIQRCAAGGRKTAFGYIWKYVNKDKEYSRGRA